MDREDLIVAILKETRDDVKEVIESSNVHRQETAVWQNDTDHRLENIEVDLREHKEGVINNRHLIQTQKEEFEKQIAAINDKLSVKHLFKLVVSVASGIGVVSGAIYKVLELIP